MAPATSLEVLGSGHGWWPLLKDAHWPGAWLHPAGPCRWPSGEGHTGFVIRQHVGFGVWCEFILPDKTQTPPHWRQQKQHWSFRWLWIFKNVCMISLASEVDGI